MQVSIARELDVEQVADAPVRVGGVDAAATCGGAAEAGPAAAFAFRALGELDVGRRLVSLLKLNQARSGPAEEAARRRPPRELDRHSGAS